MRFLYELSRLTQIDSFRRVVLARSLLDQLLRLQENPVLSESFKTVAKHRRAGKLVSTVITEIVHVLRRDRNLFYRPIEIARQISPRENGNPPNRSLLFLSLCSLKATPTAFVRVASPIAFFSFPSFRSLLSQLIEPCCRI